MSSDHDRGHGGLPFSLVDAAGVHAADLSTAAGAAVAGGRAAMEWYGREELRIEDPTGRGPVTAADRASHRAIAEALAESRPGDAVRSEELAEPPEEAGRRTAGGRLWVVDPLDGTREFIDRIPEFCVMVGLAVEGRARVGALYQPAQERLYVGVADLGAWYVEEAGEATPLDATGPVSEPWRLVRSRSHPDARIEALESALPGCEVILSGSVGTKCLLLAESRADLYVHPVPYLREWDTCAPEAVLRGAGGIVTDCSGAPLGYGKESPAQPGGIFAARPAIRDRVAKIVARVAA